MNWSRRNICEATIHCGRGSATFVFEESRLGYWSQGMVMLWHGMVWYGMAYCYGMVWYGMVWYDTVWYGMVWYGMVWYGMVWYDMVWYGMVWYGMAWYAMVWYVMVWYGMVWYGMVWYGTYAMAWYAMVCYCMDVFSNHSALHTWYIMFAIRQSVYTQNVGHSQIATRYRNDKKTHVLLLLIVCWPVALSEPNIRTSTLLPPTDQDDRRGRVGGWVSPRG